MGGWKGIEGFWMCQICLQTNIFLTSKSPKHEKMNKINDGEIATWLQRTIYFSRLNVDWMQEGEPIFIILCFILYFTYEQRGKHLFWEKKSQ